MLDAYEPVALLADEPAADEVEAILRAGGAAITTVNFAEARDVLQRVLKISRERIDAATSQLIGQSIALVPVDETIARDAADVRAHHYHRTDSPISLADCVLIAAARSAESLATADELVARVARAEGLRVIELRRRS